MIIDFYCCLNYSVFLFTEDRLFTFDSTTFQSNNDDISLKIESASGIPLGTKIHTTAYVSHYTVCIIQAIICFESMVHI